MKPNFPINIFIYLFPPYTITFNLYNKSEDANVNHSIHHIQLRSIRQELRMIQIVFEIFDYFEIYFLHRLFIFYNFIDHHNSVSFVHIKFTK